jgi:heat shock protein HslJ
MRRVRILTAVAAALLASLAVAACGDDEAAGTQPADIEGVPWVLEHGAGIQDGAGAAPTATFDGGTVSGTTGCNRFTGTYVIEGGRMSIAPGATTRKACEPPADAVERAYLAALGRVDGWRAEGDVLTLLADGSPSLRFRAASPEGSWTVTSLVMGDALTSPIAGTEITAAFAPDGTLSGSGGCNRYTTTYTTADGGIRIAPPAATQKLCVEPEGVSEQEAAYLAALPGAARFQIGEHGLELLRADGTFVATYARE